MRKYVMLPAIAAASLTVAACGGEAAGDATSGASPITAEEVAAAQQLSLIHISEPTRRVVISYAVFCLKKKN